MKIEFNDLKTQYLLNKTKINNNITRVLKHGKYILGPEVYKLEKKIIDFCGCKYCITTSSGTDSLLICLMVSNISKDDYVLIPSFTFTATAEVVMLLGAVPIFLDVEYTDFNLDINKFQDKIKNLKKKNIHPKALISVDLYGYPCDYDSIKKICKKHNIIHISDAAQSFGSEYSSNKIGNLADMTALSFFPSKPLGGYGDGGAFLTNNKVLADMAISIRSHGKGNAKYQIKRIGLNARLDTIQASVLLIKLEILKKELTYRERNSKLYDKHLKNHVILPPRNIIKKSAWAQYTIKVKNRDKIKNFLFKKNIPTMIYYPLPMHLQNAYKKNNILIDDITISQKLSDVVLSLPMSPYLKKNQIIYISDKLKEALSLFN